MVDIGPTELFIPSKIIQFLDRSFWRRLFYFISNEKPTNCKFRGLLTSSEVPFFKPRR